MKAFLTAQEEFTPGNAHCSSVGRDQMLGMEKRRKLCVFCGSPQNSKEHVFAEQLTKRMDCRDYAFVPGHFSELTGTIHYPQNLPEYFKTGNVCESCNNIWMRDMEDWFLGMVGNLVEPRFPESFASEVEALRNEPLKLIRWMAKTAIFFEFATPGFNGKVPKEIAEMVYRNQFTDDFFVGCGLVAEKGFAAGLMKTQLTRNGGFYYRSMQHEQGFGFEVLLNHFALKLIRCPSATVETIWLPAEPVPYVPFWVCPARSYGCAVSHQFPDFDSFRFSTFVAADIP